MFASPLPHTTPLPDTTPLPEHTLLPQSSWTPSAARAQLGARNHSGVATPLETPVRHRIAALSMLREPLVALPMVAVLVAFSAILAAPFISATFISVAAAHGLDPLGLAEHGLATLGPMGAAPEGRVPEGRVLGVSWATLVGAWGAVVVAAPHLIVSDLRERRLPNRIVGALGLCALAVPIIALVSPMGGLIGAHRDTGTASAIGSVATTSASPGAAMIALAAAVAVASSGILLALAGGWGMGDAKLAAVLGLLVSSRDPWRLALFGVATALGALGHALALRRRRMRWTEAATSERSPPPRDRGPAAKEPGPAVPAGEATTGPGFGRAQSQTMLDQHQHRHRHRKPNPIQNGIPCGPWLLCGALLATVVPG